MGCILILGQPYPGPPKDGIKKTGDILPRKGQNIPRNLTSKNRLKMLAALADVDASAHVGFFADERAAGRAGFSDGVFA